MTFAKKEWNGLEPSVKQLRMAIQALAVELQHLKFLILAILILAIGLFCLTKNLDCRVQIKLSVSPKIFNILID